RIGLDSDSPRGAANDARLEPRAFEKHVARRVADLALRTTDHAAEGDGVLRVGDDAGGFVELSCLSVERLHFLVLVAFADDDRFVCELVEIERVQRVSEGEHHVVGGVDDVVDRAKAYGFEALADFWRRFFDIDATNHETGIASAHLWRVDSNLDRS